MIKLRLFQIFFPIAGRLPILFYALAWFISLLIWWLTPQHRKRIKQNLSPIYEAALTKPRKSGSEVIRNVVNYYVDLAAMPYRDFEKFNRTSVTYADDSAFNFQQVVEAKSAIIMSGHIGNPEIALTALHNAGREWLEIVEPLSEPMDEFLSGIRSHTGARVATNSLKGARTALKELRNGGIVAIVADRNMTEKGVCVSVFNKHINLPAGPWQLARESRATVFPTFCHRGKWGSTKIFFDEPLQIPYTSNKDEDIKIAAQAWATIWASHLKTQPTQWTVLENFWENHRCG